MPDDYTNLPVLKTAHAKVKLETARRGHGARIYRVAAEILELGFASLAAQSRKQKKGTTV